MGLFSKGGVFYVSLTIKRKRIQKSLHIKSQKLADDLYSIFLKETFLQNPLMKLAAPRMIGPIKAFEAYIVFSQAEGQSTPAIEGKKSTLKLLARHGVNTLQNK